jgi:hypothetical protein
MKNHVSRAKLPNISGRTGDFLKLAGGREAIIEPFGIMSRRTIRAFSSGVGGGGNIAGSGCPCWWLFRQERKTANGGGRKRSAGGRRALRSLSTPALSPPAAEGEILGWRKRKGCIRRARTCGHRDSGRGEEIWEASRLPNRRRKVSQRGSAAVCCAGSNSLIAGSNSLRPGEFSSTIPSAIPSEEPAAATIRGGLSRYINVMTVCGTAQNRKFSLSSRKSAERRLLLAELRYWFAWRLPAGILLARNSVERGSSERIGSVDGWGQLSLDPASLSEGWTR